MLAISDCDFAALETDLQKTEVTIHYRENGKVKEEGISRSSCPGPHVQIVMRPHLEVTQCSCSTCRFSEEDEPTTKSIPLEDVFDVVVDEWGPDPDYQDQYSPLPFARWLRNRLGILVRLALD
jgi:hypothetical protein